MKLKSRYLLPSDHFLLLQWKPGDATPSPLIDPNIIEHDPNEKAAEPVTEKVWRPALGGNLPIRLQALQAPNLDSEDDECKEIDPTVEEALIAGCSSTGIRKTQKLNDLLPEMYCALDQQSKPEVKCRIDAPSMRIHYHFYFIFVYLRGVARTPC